MRKGERGTHVVSAGWDIGFVDGKPEVVVDASTVAEMVRNSPLGVDAALDRLRGALPATLFLHVRNLLGPEHKEQE